MEQHVRVRDQAADHDQLPPAKRLKTAGPQVRATEYFDLSQSSSHQDQEPISRLLQRLQSAHRIVAPALCCLFVAMRGQ